LVVNELTFPMSSGAIRIGPAGWSYKDWEGIVYPPHGSRFDHLAWLAGFFDTIEVNSPFYRIPPPTHASSWARRIAFNRHFQFTVKLFRGFTHEKELVAADLRAYRHFLEPLAAAGRLGALLMQFPWSFKNDQTSRARLEKLFAEFADYPIALEVRHATFQNDAFAAFLGGHGVGFVNIDQPLFSDSVKPAEIVTGSLGYVRFHGRNYQKWFAHEESWERYDYLYPPEELEPWARRVETMASENKDVYVITNNHFRGQAIVNALDLQRMLGQETRVPPPMKEMMEERWS
jgi:uncharacterized protein YecE (DUF72 family)